MARQTEETACCHKSVSHVPNSYRKGWVFLPLQLSLVRHTAAGLTDKLFVSQTFLSGPVPQIQLLADLMPVQRKRLIRQGGDRRELRRPAHSPAVVLVCRVSLKDHFFETTNKTTQTNPKPSRLTNNFAL